MQITKTTAPTLLTTPQDVEREYGIPRTTTMDLLKRGHLRAVKLPGCSRVFVRRADLERMVAPAELIT